MSATLLLNERHILSETSFVEMVVWRLSKPLEGSRHAFKYRLAFVVNGRCVMRYDNETGKGDHKHVGKEEFPYAFTTPQALLNDFWEDVEIGAVEMRTVTLEVSSRDRVNERFLRAFEGEEQGEFISFDSPQLLFKVLSGKRWDLLKVMTGAGPMTIRETARRMERDVKAVHGDVKALLAAGLLRKTEKGQILFPFDAVHVNFMLRAA